MSPLEPAIEVVNVSKRFDDGTRHLDALRDVSCSIARGEFVAIVGPSGSGKSTLLHLMGALDAPTRGDIRLEGRAFGALGDTALTLLRRRRIGFVFQFFNLLPALTVEENVAVPLLLDGVSRRVLWPRVRDMLARVGLADRNRRRADALSGGEMQRVALARALVTAPAVVLADEPTGNLDAVTGESILGLLRDLGRALGQTTVLVTHDARAAAAADRVLTLVAGEIVDVRPARRESRDAAGARSCGAASQLHSPLISWRGAR